MTVDGVIDVLAHTTPLTLTTTRCEDDAPAVLQRKVYISFLTSLLALRQGGLLSVSQSVSHLVTQRLVRAVVRLAAQVQRAGENES